MPLMQTILRAVSNNSPRILTAMAVTGVISTTVLAVRATPEATHKLDSAPDDATRVDKFKKVWKFYVPAAAVGSVTIACIIGGHTISTKRSAALMSLYTITERGFREYQDKVVETIGEQRSKKVKDDVAKDRVDANPVTANTVVILGKGDVLCYDSLSGVYFQSDMETIRKAQNDINQKLLNEGYASQNEFYALIGMKPNIFGEENGWNQDHMLEVDFTTVMSDDNRPCISLDYRMYPVRGYYNSFHE